MTNSKSACPQRRSIRLPGYDYTSPGAYFITLVAFQRLCLFGVIRDGEVELSEEGQLMDEKFREIPDHFPNVELGAFVVMPNHLHGIIILHDVPRRGVVPTPVGGSPGAIDPDDFVGTRNGLNKGDVPSLLPKRPTLGQVVAYYKYQTTKQVNAARNTAGMPLWQRNYYEHIIRK